MSAVTLPKPAPGGVKSGLLTKRDLAVFLGVTPRTIETYQNRGLPFYRLGPRRNRYNLDAVLAWLDPT